MIKHLTKYLTRFAITGTLTFAVGFIADAQIDTAGTYHRQTLNAQYNTIYR